MWGELTPGLRSVRRDQYTCWRAIHFESDAGGEFLHANAARAAIEDEAAIIGDDRIDHGGAGKRQAALLDALGIARLVGVVHHHDDALDARDKVHRPAHAFHHLARPGPVRATAAAPHPPRPPARHLDITPADHPPPVRHP